MGTPKMDARLPRAMSLKERLGRNVTDADKHVAMGAEATTGVPKHDPRHPAGRKAMER